MDEAQEPQPSDFGEIVIGADRGGREGQKDKEVGCAEKLNR